MEFYDPPYKIPDCIYNAGVGCRRKNRRKCSRCGWNPAEAARRRLGIQIENAAPGDAIPETANKIIPAKE